MPHSKFAALRRPGAFFVDVFPAARPGGAAVTRPAADLKNGSYSRGKARHWIGSDESQGQPMHEQAPFERCTGETFWWH